ncbi:hypothetical protein NST50_24640 [Paenibacillus sp. FSL E2-0202]
MKKKKQQQRRLKDPPRQPTKCKGCIWGRWEEIAQYCARVKCQKEKST